MKNIFLFLIFLFYSFTGTTQTDKDWLISMDFGRQEHDKRLFGAPHQETFLKKHPEKYGTYQIGVSVLKKIIKNNRIELLVGTGLSTELATFQRPYDYSIGKEGFSNSFLRYTDRYYQNLLQLPIRTRLFYYKRMAITLDLLPQFNFRTLADISLSDREPTVWWRFNFYSFEINPGLGFSIKGFNFGLKYRAFQLKKIDRILFNDLIYDPRINQKYEKYNLIKLWFSMGYEF